MGMTNYVEEKAWTEISVTVPTAILMPQGQ